MTDKLDRVEPGDFLEAWKRITDRIDSFPKFYRMSFYRLVRLRQKGVEPNDEIDKAIVEILDHPEYKAFRMFDDDHDWNDAHDEKT